jgi:hypothetical protein
MSNSSGLASSAARGTRRSKRSADLFFKVCGSWATKTEKPQTPESVFAPPRSRGASALLFRILVTQRHALPGRARTFGFEVRSSLAAVALRCSIGTPRCAPSWTISRALRGKHG